MAIFIKNLNSPAAKYWQITREEFDKMQNGTIATRNDCIDYDLGKCQEVAIAYSPDFESPWGCVSVNTC